MVLLDYDYGGLDGLQKVAMQYLDSAFGSPMLEASALKFGSDAGQISFQILNTIWDMFVPIGITLLCIYFVWAVNRTMMLEGQDFTLKSIGAVLLKFGIGYAFLSQGGRLFSAFFGLNDALIDELVRGFQSISVNGEGTNWYVDKGIRDSLFNQVKESGFFETLGIIASCIVMALIGALVSAVIAYQSVSRKIEMLLRAGMAPVALGDMFNGENSNGWRYIKKFLALTLWGVAMLALVKIGVAIQSGYITSAAASGLGITSFTSMVNLIVVPLAVAGMCSASKQVCNDVLGV